MSTRTLEVLAAAPGATVQDLGRPGWAAVGVGRAGAADLATHRLANRLVGNPPDAAALEVTAGGLRLRAGAALWVAVTGADVPVTLDGTAVAAGTPLRLPVGGELALGMARTGLRATVAVRGGIDVPPVLGSRSRCTLSGVGPAPLAPGQVLPVGAPTGPWHPADHVPGPTALRAPGTVPRVRLLPGPRADWVCGCAWTVLDGTLWRAGPDLDRVGVRLDGPPLHRLDRGELPSEGLVPGAVQVPPGGGPVVFLADHPTTGGYPVVAVADAAGVAELARLRPGDPVRLLTVHGSSPEQSTVDRSCTRLS